MDPDFLADPFGGRGFLLHSTPTKRTWICETSPGTHQICDVENVDPVLEANQRMLNDSAGEKWGDGRVAASIPPSIFWRGDFKKAFDANDQTWMKRFLNNSDNAKLRTFKGRL